MMPTKVKIRGQKASTGVAPQEGYFFDGYTIDHGSMPVYQSYITRPGRVRRVKPADLFAAATPWKVESIIYTYTNSSYSYRRDGGVWKYDGPSSYWYPAPSQPHPVAPDPYIIANVDLKLRSKIANEKVDLLAALAEAHKTADLFTEVTKDIASSLRALRRGRPISAVKRLLADPRTRSDRALANRWLQYQWGLLPTLSDVYEAAEALATRINEGMYHYYTARHREERTHEYAPMRGSVQWTRIHRARARVKFDSAQLFQLQTLGVTNPLASIYQLIPWSFALDWVSNLGDIIAGLDDLLGVSEVLVQRGCTVSVSGQWTLEVQGGGGTIHHRLCQRLGVDGDLSFGALTLKGPLSTNSPLTRIANATALARQLLR